MTNSQIRCEQCRRWFRPIRSPQTTCRREACQREHHRKNCREWRRKNPRHGPAAVKVRDWAAKRGYWRWYRETHPEYCERDNRRRRQARRAAKRDSRRHISLEKLRSIQESSVDLSAKRDSSDRRVDEIVTYLIWRDAPQNETHAEIAPL